MQLHELIHPVLRQAFFARYWEVEPLHVSRDQPDYLSFLFSLRDLDYLLEHHPSDARIHVADTERKRNRKTAYVETDLGSIYESFSRGSTLVVEGLHRFWEPVSRLCRNLLMETGMKTHANLYVTPGSQTGFDCHWDGHDVMILQLEGTKKWQLYPATRHLPRPNSPGGACEKKTDPPSQTVKMQPGDVLYLPRGTPHQATAGDATSVHLTVGLIATTWEDLLVAAVRAFSARNELMRKSLPSHWHSDGKSLGAFLNIYQELTRELFSEPNMEDALALLGMEFFEGIHFVPDGHVTQLDLVDRINLDTTVHKRSGNLMRIVRTVEQVVLLFPGGSCAGPSKLFWAFSFMADSKSFKVAEIPGWYNDEERVNVVKNLVRCGFLRVGALESPRGVPGSSKTRSV